MGKFGGVPRNPGQIFVEMPVSQQRIKHIDRRKRKYELQHEIDQGYKSSFFNLEYVWQTEKCTYHMIKVRRKLNSPLDLQKM